MKKTSRNIHLCAAAFALYLVLAGVERARAQAPVYATVFNPHQPALTTRTRGTKPLNIAQPGKANNPDAPPTELKYPRTRGSNREAILAVFEAGVEADIAGKYQLEKLRTYLGTYNDVQIANFAGILGQSASGVEQVFILKSFVAGESWANLLAYAAEMRGQSESEIIRRSTMRDDPDLVQQWQDSCGPSMLQAVAGEADPRYAWELNKLGDISRIDPLGANAALAGQQKEWLEKNGGTAVLRGQTGRGIPMTEFLNEALGPIVGATYVCQASTNPDYTLNRITEILLNGYDVPICIGWDESGSSNHFLVMLAVRGQLGNRAFQIHDSWTGKTAWVSEASVRQNRLAPIFDTFAKLSYYYEPIPK